MLLGVQSVRCIPRDLIVPNITSWSKKSKLVFEHSVQEPGSNCDRPSAFMAGDGWTGTAVTASGKLPSLLTTKATEHQSVSLQTSVDFEQFCYTVYWQLQ